PVPTPAPTGGSAGHSGSAAGTDTDTGWGELSRSRSRERERPCKCPPEKGQRLPPPHVVTGLSAEYQHYVTGFPIGLEFFFSGKWFDGFDSPKCLLQEAKANYDFFFEANGNPKFFFFHGKGPNNPDPAKSTSAYKSIMREAETQGEVVIDNPPARLRWYFMQERFYRWVTKEFASEGLPISTELKPMA
ncbi:Tox-REase-5 domain-containing protein, partial [Burkholderia ubonensis]|uniref:Tox-REase-5 domain-containing protein n=1 Tax=Burkholderia ubonensis TaxID=101571 RepID=UPI0009B3F3A0